MNGIQVLNFNDQSIKDDFERSIKTSRLIPVIGSGFTRNCVAANGNVPTGSKMKNFMLEEIFRDPELEAEADDLKKESFQEICTLYESTVDREIRRNYLKILVKISCSSL